MEHGKERKGYVRKPWNTDDDNMLRQLYPNHTGKECSKLMDRSLTSLYQRAAILGIEKSEEFLLSDKSGRVQRGKQSEAMKANQFKPGQVSWNKGKKGLHFAGSEKGQFKKGNLPHNAKDADGVIATRTDKLKDGSVRQYKWIRLSLGKWKELHRHIWEQAYGPIPKGCCIVFKDGNSLNCVLGNLEMITRKENAQRNSIHRYGPEVRELIMLTKKAEKLLKSKQDEQ